MSSPFIFKPPRKSVVEAQELQTGNPPIDKVDPFNYPYKLVNNGWFVYAVEGNLWRCVLQRALELQGVGTDTDTTVPEGNWNFGHVIHDVYFHQFVTATGVRDGTAFTWEWARRVGGDYFPIRRGVDQPELNIAVEDIFYRSNYEDYRWRVEGVATNSVTVEMWVEVLRI